MYGWWSALAAEGAVAGPHDGLAALGDMELVQDGRDVVGHGLGREVQAGADLGVGESPGEVVEDVALPAGQGGEGDIALWRWSGEPAAQPAGQRGAEHGLAGGDRAYGGDDVGAV